MYERILLTLDGSEAAEAALPHMEIVYKGCEKPQVTLLRVVESVPPPGVESGAVITADMLMKAQAANREDADKYLKAVAARLSAVGIPVKTQVLAGRIADTIIEYIDKNKIDLLIMSTHGRSGLSRWAFGSVAEKILHHICIPITLMRAPGCGPQFKDAAHP